MRSISAAAAASFSLAALAWLPLTAHGQGDLPTDGDDRPVLGELPLAPLERYYANPPGVTVENVRRRPRRRLGAGIRPRRPPVFDREIRTDSCDQPGRRSRPNTRGPH